MKNVFGKLVFRCTPCNYNVLCPEQMRFTYTSIVHQNRSEERIDVREIRRNNEYVIKSTVYIKRCLLTSLEMLC